jgi:hypothetical protein
MLGLFDNKLTGTIPSEIALLTNLSEYTVTDWHDAIAHSLLASIHIHLVILTYCLDCLCSSCRSLEQYTHWYDSI